MNLVHFLAAGDNRLGGPYYSIPSLVGALNRVENVRAALVMTNGNAADFAMEGVSVFNRGEFFDAAGRVNLPQPFDRPDLVVFHSTYIPAHAGTARRLTRLGVPYVVCPRGGMTRRAQRSKWLKKRIGNLLFLNRLVAGAAGIHFLTEGEAEASEGWGRPSVVVGNGVDLPADVAPAASGSSPRRRFVFIGRLAADHKGLDLLIEACRLVRTELIEHDVQLQLFGPDWRGTRRRLMDRIVCSGLERHVLLPGPVGGDAKTKALREADVFVLTSRWEGHPISVLEALSFGVPCLLTPGTNMADVVARHGAGWRVEPSPESIAAAIQRLVNADGQTLRAAGRNARELAAREYGWDTVGRKTAKAYEGFIACASRSDS